MNTHPEFDVVVVGAGPAGATTAGLLAKEGLRVVVFERAHFPRFHIGESLLPAGLPAIDALGIEMDDHVAVFKRGAQFVCERTDRVASFDFAEALEGCPSHAWHVDRARFDQALATAAEAHGADVRFGVSVEGFEVDADGVTVDTDAGSVRARYVVDATGQDRLVAKRAKAVEPYRNFGKAAVFTHFEGLTDDALAAIGEGNDIRIMMIEDGWGWLIPLPGRRLSVGLVSQRRGIRDEWLDDFLATSPIAQRWTDGATRGPTRLLSNFSFKNTAAYGPRYACVGDAACFLDPVFSSGVALAMRGASQLAGLLTEALREGTEGDAELMIPLGASMERAYATLAAFIDRFYNRRIVENLFFGAPDDGAMRSAVISVLAGDVWRTDNPFQDMLLHSRRSRPRAAVQVDANA